MWIGKVSVKNFQSYKELAFDYDNLGLSLLSGDTGSGKSSLLDAVSWVIFGCTSKETGVDEVKAWGTTGTTEGTAEVRLSYGGIKIVRSRCPNDLYWQEEEEAGKPEHRGKDLTETQRLLEKRLGCTAELFFLGSYLTQFSKADNFFIAKAKDRREVLENIADQDFAINLADRASEARKTSKKERDGLALRLSKAEGSKDAIADQANNVALSSSRWLSEQAKKIKEIEIRHKNYEYDVAKQLDTLLAQAKALKEPRPDSFYTGNIKAIRELLSGLAPSTCSACGALTEHIRKEEYLRQLASVSEERAKNLNLSRQVQNIKDKIFELNKVTSNPYTDRLKEMLAETDPFADHLSKIQKSKLEIEENIARLKHELSIKNKEVSQLSWLYDKSFELRSLLMSKVVAQVETATNVCLERFFDAALRIKLSLVDSDKLDVEVYNNGHSCTFKSLSGGERTMLKLAFSLSIMRVAQDKAGVSFGMIMLDEPFNGLSDSLKVKAFGLLQHLETEYPTVLVIDHSSELKNQFDRTFVVDKSSGFSEIHEQSKDN